MRGLIAAFALAAAFAAPAVAAEQRYAVAGFDRVRAAGPFDVTISTGGPVSVVATGTRAALDRLVVEVQGGQLVIRAAPRDGNRWYRDGDTLSVQVRVPALRGVTLAGSGDVRVDRAQADGFAGELVGSGDLTIGAIRVRTATLSANGSGTLTVAGRTGATRIQLNGSGDVRAGGLEADTADVALTGSGSIAAAASRTATVRLMGSGDVSVRGGARCTVTKRGSGTARCG